MFRKTIMAAVFATVVAAPAVAGHCPKDAAAIDSALAKLDVSDDVKAKVTELRNKGMEQHQAGDHAASVDTLSEAMRTLLMAVK